MKITCPICRFPNASLKFFICQILLNWSRDIFSSLFKYSLNSTLGVPLNSHNPILLITFPFLLILPVFFRLHCFQQTAISFFNRDEFKCVNWFSYFLTPHLLHFHSIQSFLGKSSLCLSIGLFLLRNGHHNFSIDSEWLFRDPFKTEIYE